MEFNEVCFAVYSERDNHEQLTRMHAYMDQKWKLHPAIYNDTNMSLMIAIYPVFYDQMCK